MTEVQKKLDRAYSHMQQVPVSGGGVKHLALAMQELEDAFKLLGKEGETAGGASPAPAEGNGRGA